MSVQTNINGTTQTGWGGMPAAPAPGQDTRSYAPCLHYSASDGKIRIGYGSTMSPRCGQSEWITVTDRPELVDCLKCTARLAKDGVL